MVKQLETSTGLSIPFWWGQKCDLTGKKPILMDDFSEMYIFQLIFQHMAEMNQWLMDDITWVHVDFSEMYWIADRMRKMMFSNTDVHTFFVGAQLLLTVVTSRCRYIFHISPKIQTFEGSSSDSRTGWFWTRKLFSQWERNFQDHKEWVWYFVWWGWPNSFDSHNTCITYNWFSGTMWPCAAFQL